MKKIIYSLIGLGFVLNFNNAYGMTPSNSAGFTEETPMPDIRSTEETPMPEENKNELITDLVQQLDDTKRHIKEYDVYIIPSLQVKYSKLQEAYEEAEKAIEQAKLEGDMEKEQANLRLKRDIEKRRHYSKIEVLAYEDMMKDDKNRQEILEEAIKYSEQICSTQDPKAFEKIQKLKQDVNTKGLIYQLTKRLNYTKKWISDFDEYIISLQTAYEEAESAEKKANLQERIDAIGNYVKQLEGDRKKLEDRITSCQQTLTENSVGL